MSCIWYNKKARKEDRTPLSSAAMQSVFRSGYATTIARLVDEGWIKLVREAVWGSRCRDYVVGPAVVGWETIKATDLDKLAAVRMDKALGGKSKWLKRINTALLTIPDDAPDWVKEDTADGMVKLDSNNRVVSAVCNLPKEVRSRVKFKGQNIAEVDVSSSHVRLLIQHYSKELPKSELVGLVEAVKSGFYRLATDCRDMAYTPKAKAASKNAFYALINGKKISNLSPVKEIKGKKPSLYSCWREVFATHFPTLLRLMYRDKSINGYKFLSTLLQRMEADKMKQLETMVGEKAVAFTVYDSVAVLTNYADKAKKAIDELWNVDDCIDSPSSFHPTIAYTGTSKIDKWMSIFRNVLNKSFSFSEPITYRRRFGRKKKRPALPKPIKQLSIFSFA